MMSASFTILEILLLRPRFVKVEENIGFIKEVLSLENKPRRYKSSHWLSNSKASGNLLRTSYRIETTSSKQFEEFMLDESYISSIAMMSNVSFCRWGKSFTLEFARNHPNDLVFGSETVAGKKAFLNSISCILFMISFYDNFPHRILLELLTLYLSQKLIHLPWIPMDQNILYQIIHQRKSV